MTDEILKSRYEFRSDGKAIIDISVDEIGDLFNSFDKKAVFARRDLDEDFEDYLIECVRELGKTDFVIQITIDRDYNQTQEDALRKAIKNQFTYLYGIEYRKIVEEGNKVIFLFILGIVIGLVVYTANVPDSQEVETWRRICSEGAVIAMWVAFWEAVDSLIFGFRPYNKNRKIYHKIISAELKIQVGNVETQNVKN